MLSLSWPCDDNFSQQDREAIAVTVDLTDDTIGKLCKCRNEVQTSLANSLEEYIAEIRQTRLESLQREDTRITQLIAELRQQRQEIGQYLSRIIDRETGELRIRLTLQGILQSGYQLPARNPDDESVIPPSDSSDGETPSDSGGQGDSGGQPILPSGGVNFTPNIVLTQQQQQTQQGTNAGSTSQMPNAGLVASPTVNVLPAPINVQVLNAIDANGNALPQFVCNCPQCGQQIAPQLPSDMQQSLSQSQTQKSDEDDPTNVDKLLPWIFYGADKPWKNRAVMWAGDEFTPILRPLSLASLAEYVAKLEIPSDREDTRTTE